MAPLLSPSREKQEVMGNSLRCCLSCVLPCGALDMIRIVHLDGHVEEHRGPITAGDVLKANPNHVLSKTCSQGVVRKIIILAPKSDLKRGQLYFLLPASSIPNKKKNQLIRIPSQNKNNQKQASSSGVPDCDRYLAQILSEKKFSRSDRRHGGACIWQPDLESISEDL